MAAALHLPPSEHVPSGPHLNDVPLNLVAPSQDMYARRLTITELDLKDNRYPTLTAHSKPYPSTSSIPLSYSDRTDERPVTSASRRSWVDYSQQDGNNSTNSNTRRPDEWTPDQLVDEPPNPSWARQQRSQSPNEQGSPAFRQTQAQSSYPSNNTSSHIQQSSSGVSPYDRDVAREERFPRMPSSASGGSAEQPQQSRITPAALVPLPETPSASSALQTSDMGQRVSGVEQFQERSQPVNVNAPHRSSMAGVGAGPSSATLSPIVPLSAGPSYSPAAMAIPISQSPRAYPQQPTYINQPSGGPKAAYAPPQIPKEEVCVECAMRDQDMADVDVTSPGIWERESDAAYEELVRLDDEDDALGRPHPDNRPRARGDPLTEGNLRVWLSINPKEPSSRQQTLDQYVRSQRTLLEAEALARAKAMRESRVLDDRMRDAYSQLRRSAYEHGSIAQPVDDSGGLRLKAPHTPLKDHHREVTLLENGMIVEHVDVKREEKERRKEERRERERSRARKSSRSSRSGADVTSLYSLNGAPGLPTDSGFFSGIKSDPRLSQSLSARPSSVLTSGNERPSMPRAMSQASFSDLQSIGSTSSPRRSRFFGFKNLSAGFRSQDSLAPSGSMIDMHVALQREQQYLYPPGSPAVDIGSNAPTLRPGDSWQNGQNPAGPSPPANAEITDNTPAKKSRGFKKIWRIVTGSKSTVHGSNGGSRNRARSQSVGESMRMDDDGPLAPPPPLSYLVNRDQRSPGATAGHSQGANSISGALAGARRHMSTPSLHSVSSPNLSSPFIGGRDSMGMPPHSPASGTAPTSVVPSPTSSSKDKEESNRPATMYGAGGNEGAEYINGDLDADARGRSSRAMSPYGTPSLAPPGSPTPQHQFPSQSQSRPPSSMLRRDKSLPPLPAESSVDFPNPSSQPGYPNHLPVPDASSRPQTVFTYDPRGYPFGVTPGQGGYAQGQDGLFTPPQAAFRTTTDTRRQSFGGISSRPHSVVQTVPVRGARGQVNVPPFLAEEKYNEFGAATSRVSLNQWPVSAEKSGSTSAQSRSLRGQMMTPDGPKKRKSKFGLSSLFGKKSTGHSINDAASGSEYVDFPGLRTSQSDSYDPTTGSVHGNVVNGYAGSPSNGHAPKSSLSKRIELVDQDRDFVAYRYPSTEQTLNLMR
ncbi:hypothetical protein K474DRAFT_1703393 [Panus rudis PR-1116 ss-1]|nr:hypothetical protein K474DRAFT_1703393 [Panus rudis PR-1116 ss-1]